MKTLKTFLAFASLLPLGGCGILYTNVHVPRAYRSATAGEVKSEKTDPIVSGKACSHSVLFLVAWGDAGYAKASENALKGDPNALLYDVKADQQLKSILGVYTEACTLLTGKAAKP